MNSKDNLARKGEPNGEPNEGQKKKKIAPVSLPGAAESALKDLTRHYNEAFFNPKVKPGPSLEDQESLKRINNLIEEGLKLGQSPSPEQLDQYFGGRDYFGRASLVSPEMQKISGTAELEISKLILAADFMKNDLNLTVTDPRAVKLLGKTPQRVPHLMINFSNSQYEKNKSAEAGGMYLDQDRANFLTFAAVSGQSPAFLVNESALREGAVHLRQDLSPTDLIRTLNTSAKINNDQVEVGAARADFKDRTLESLMDGKNSRMYLIRGINIINCSDTSSSKSGKIELRKGDFLVVLSKQLIDALVKIESLSEVQVESIGSEELLARELLTLINSSRDSRGRVDRIEVTQKVLMMIDSFLKSQRRPGLLPSMLIMVEVP